MGHGTADTRGRRNAIVESKHTDLIQSTLLGEDGDVPVIGTS